MRIAIISGSHRKNSQSRRVADFLGARLAALDPGGAADIIDLAGNPLPLWSEDSVSAQQWQPYAARMQAAEGLVIISPEWSGMVPPGLKNFLLFASAAEVAHKPALIVAVSATRGGSYPVSELRMSGFKNNRLLYIPEHLIVRDVAQYFAGAEPAGKDDAWLRERADFTLRILLAYAAALAPIRQSGITSDKKFAHGM